MPTAVEYALLTQGHIHTGGLDQDVVVQPSVLTSAPALELLFTGALVLVLAVMVVLTTVRARRAAVWEGGDG